MSLRISLLGAALSHCVVALPCAAAVNKCTDSRSKVTCQDNPCAATPQSSKVDTSNPVDTRPAGVATAPQRMITKSWPAGDDAEFRSAKGAWRGPALFQFSVSGARAADAHAIGRMVIDLQPDGRVRGVIYEAGCKLNGFPHAVRIRCQCFYRRHGLRLQGRSIQHALFGSPSGQRCGQGIEAATQLNPSGERRFGLPAGSAVWSSWSG